MNGGVINLRIVMAAAEAIVTKYDRKKLARYGEHIEIIKHYARSLLHRMGFVKRKGTKAVKNMPNDFDKIETELINRVDKVKNDDSVPDLTGIRRDANLCRVGTGLSRPRTQVRYRSLELITRERKRFFCS